MSKILEVPLQTCQKRAFSETRFLLGFSDSGFPTEELRAGSSHRRYSSTPLVVARVDRYTHGRVLRAIHGRDPGGRMGTKATKAREETSQDEQCKRDNEIYKAVFKGEVRDLIGGIPVLQNFIERRSGRKITARTKDEKMRDHEAAQRIGKPV